VTDEEVQNGEAPPIKFDTFFFDDYIKLEVFHNGSTQKSSKIGKTFIKVRELNCKDF